MTQHHIVVMYDSATGEWSTDEETQLVSVSPSKIYDPVTERWLNAAGSEIDDDLAEYDAEVYGVFLDALAFLRSLGPIERPATNEPSVHTVNSEEQPK